MPYGYADLWHHFCALDGWRGAGGMGMAPLTLHDVEVYERRYGVTLTPEECDVLKRIDAKRLAATHAKESER